MVMATAAVVAVPHHTGAQEMMSHQHPVVAEDSVTEEVSVIQI
jgi:hypothetical protein